MNAFLTCAMAAGYAIAGLVVLRYWNRSRDRLFALFAVAFWILAFNRTAFALTAARAEITGYLYLVRLLAFAIVLVAIVDKNRASR